MSKVLITGIRGFIGSHLAKSLIADGHQVLGVDNGSNPSPNKLPKNSYFWADVRDGSQVSAYVANCDVVFHLAAEISVDKSINYPGYVNDVNIGGTLNILEQCRKFNKRMVFASSSEVYGSSQEDFMSEAHPLDPQSPYAASKAAADRMAFAYSKTYGLPVTIVRNFNTFGDYQSFTSYGGAIAKFVYRALHNQPPQIYGDGEQERDYMSVRDAVAAYKVALEEKSIGKVANFGTGKTVKIKDLAEMVVKQINPSLKPEHVAQRKGEVQRLCADITLAKSLGFSPTTDFEKDLSLYIDWFRRSQ